MPRLMIENFIGKQEQIRSRIYEMVHFGNYVDWVEIE